MTVYAEFVLVSNVIIDAFLGALTVIVLKGKIIIGRVILFSIIGGILSCVYPLIGNYGIIIKVVTAFFLPPILIKINKLLTYITAVAVFLAISFALGGAVLALNLFLEKEFTFQSMTYGEVPLIFSSSGLLILTIVGVVKKNRSGIAKRNGNTYDAVIKTVNGICRCRAYYDSGNRVYTNYGEKVVFASESVYNMLMPEEEDYIAVVTPIGERVMHIIDADIMIYFPSGANKIYSVKVGRGEIFGDIPIILHCDMTEDE